MCAMVQILEYQDLAGDSALVSNSRQLRFMKFRNIACLLTAV